MTTDNIILQLPGSMEAEAVTSQDVATYVETPAPTPDNVPAGLVQTLPAMDNTPRNAVDDFIASLESVWTSAAPILQTLGVTNAPTGPNQGGAVKSPAQIAAENEAARSKQMLALVGVAALVYILTR